MSMSKLFKKLTRLSKKKLNNKGDKTSLSLATLYIEPIYGERVHTYASNKVDTLLFSRFDNASQTRNLI